MMGPPSRKDGPIINVDCGATDLPDRSTISRLSLPSHLMLYWVFSTAPLTWQVSSRALLMGLVNVSLRGLKTNSSC